MHERSGLRVEEEAVSQARPHIPFGVRQEWREPLVERERRVLSKIGELGTATRAQLSPRCMMMLDDAGHWLAEMPANSIHAIVTDPPYGLVEYSETQVSKRRRGKGGVWRIPPAFDGAKRAPVPRFTELTDKELESLHAFFTAFALGALKALVPGGHVFIASNPLVSTLCFHALQSSGLEKRAEVIRLVQTLRGGDRPKGAEAEFSDVTVMPRSAWEPWGLFRKPFAGTVAANLRLWGAGALRRPSEDAPFKDVIACAPTRAIERRLAPHPSLKPQRFLRKIVRASLPLGLGIVYDPFAGSGSTLAAAEALGYAALGTDHDADCFDMSRKAFEGLSKLDVSPTLSR